MNDQPSRPGENRSLIEAILNKMERLKGISGKMYKYLNWRLPPVYFLICSMKLRQLKKKHPSKLERIWIKHLIEWKYNSTEYKTIRNYYIKSCRKHLHIN